MDIVLDALVQNVIIHVTQYYQFRSLHIHDFVFIEIVCFKFCLWFITQHELN